MASSSSFNLIGTGGTGGYRQQRQSGQRPPRSFNLAPLGYYGGPTETLALLPGSLAIGHGSVGVTTDQRGFMTPGNTSISRRRLSVRSAGGQHHRRHLRRR